ncbi:hypothetical protein P3G55_12320 [Leptospira sp. 96542]|nr:hypothetical protein [Leptospira sp. 96542]
MHFKIVVILLLSLFCFCVTTQKNCETTECRNGWHTVPYENGDSFSGNFLENSKEGVGVYTYHNGDRFEGEYKSNLREGNGVYLYESGDRFVGYYHKGKRNGSGKYHFNDGLILEGEWVDDVLSGQVKIVNAKGSLVWEGDWSINTNQSLESKTKLGEGVEIPDSE